MHSEPKLTLWQRLTAETPAFFKRAQAFGLGLIALGSSLTQVPGISDKVTTGLISAGGAIAAIAQFAVKQCDTAPQPPVS